MLVWALPSLLSESTLCTQHLSTVLTTGWYIRPWISTKILCTVAHRLISLSLGILFCVSGAFLIFLYRNALMSAATKELHLPDVVWHSWGSGSNRHGQRSGRRAAEAILSCPGSRQCGRHLAAASRTWHSQMPLPSEENSGLPYPTFKPGHFTTIELEQHKRVHICVCMCKYTRRQTQRPHKYHYLIWRFTAKHLVKVHILHTQRLGDNFSNTN